MKDFMLMMLVWFLLIAFIVGMAWLSQGNEFFMYKYFAPKTEAVRRQVFEQSKAYNQGMIQELQNMQFDYLRNKDPNSKKAMASIILHRVADYDLEKCPVDLRNFIENLRSNER